MARIREKSPTVKEKDPIKTRVRFQEILYKILVRGYASLTDKDIKFLKPIWETIGKGEPLEHFYSKLEEANDLIIKDLERIWDDFIKGETHYSPDFFCWCPSCLYLYYMLSHKNSKIRKDHFFFAWLVLFVCKPKKKYLRHNWDLAENLWLKVTCEPLKFPSKRERYRVFARYKKVVLEALKLRLLILVSAPSHIKTILAGDFRKIEKQVRSDKRFAEKAILYIKEKKGVTQRQLERRFSRKKEEVERLLNELDSLSSYKWDSKKKKISYLGHD